MGRHVPHDACMYHMMAIWPHVPNLLSADYRLILLCELFYWFLLLSYLPRNMPRRPQHAMKPAAPLRPDGPHAQSGPNAHAMVTRSKARAMASAATGAAQSSQQASNGQQTSPAGSHSVAPKLDPSDLFTYEPIEEVLCYSTSDLEEPARSTIKTGLKSSQDHNLHGSRGAGAWWPA